MNNNKGSLVCVGPGMTLGAHISQRCRHHIESADVVFTSCHPIMEDWIATMNPDVRSLQGMYGENKDRRITYQEMHEAIMAEIRAGKRVVGAFYGHPGVFAKVPHQAIAQARKEGFNAHMEPGISAEDCLYADMGIDPGTYGCQHFEASQYMFYNHIINPYSYVILWQIALAGDLSISKRVSSAAERQVLVDMLLEHYTPEHKVGLYECPSLITDAVRMDWIELKDLATAELNPVTTMVIPPGKKLLKNEQIVAQLAAINQI
ncbi:hypothetical protein DXV75_08650 [Alteromonas aestuariivivens]|uniref:Tetrapyrrole methylase domain-containing protein n=1 Tax=Alteromonas aestuariivivens TaxID=1938339 RepID=A0A3D8M8B5_9ALTE|nr:SAM-dependent methyltransferase [Alteromonas aestuariivivens]RDV26135.1 hypothetical protein DXV75_08650 [Alteromonas aestuariivivens]